MLFRCFCGLAYIGDNEEAMDRHLAFDCAVFREACKELKKKHPPATAQQNEHGIRA